MVKSGALVTSAVEVEIGKTTPVVPELQPCPLSFLGNKTPTKICRSFCHWLYNCWGAWAPPPPPSETSDSAANCATGESDRLISQPAAPGPLKKQTQVQSSREAAAASSLTNRPARFGRYLWISRIFHFAHAADEAKDCVPLKVNRSYSSHPNICLVYKIFHGLAPPQLSEFITLKFTKQSHEKYNWVWLPNPI